MKKIILFLLASLFFLAACGSGEDSESTDNSGESENTTEQGLDGDSDSADEQGSNEMDNDDGVESDQGETENEEGDGAEEGENAATDDQRSLYDRNVQQFDLSISFSDEREWEYQYEDNEGETEAQVEKENGEGYEGSEAVSEIEDILQNLFINSNMEDEQIRSAVLDLLEVQEDEVDEFELEIEFENEDPLEVEM